MSTPSLERQQWLENVTRDLRAHFTKCGHTVPANVRVSIGWPHGSRTSKAGGSETIGQCWFDAASTDKHFEIFISPKLADSVEIIATNAHELVHVVAGPKAKHGPAFKRVAESIGLEGKMTSTVAGPAMKALAAKMIAKHGAYPAGALRVLRNPFKQSTRLIKCSCDECGYNARVTRKWINDAGAPYCGTRDHGRMQCEEVE